MNGLRITVAVILILLAAYITAVNWCCVIVSMRNKRRGIHKHHSTVPLISLILAALAYAVCSFSSKAWIGIIPAVDIGNWALVIGLPCAIAKGAFRKKAPTQMPLKPAR
jgi:hypothetical protein